MFSENTKMEVYVFHLSIEIIDLKFKNMKIEVHLLSQSKAIVYENVKNAYTKDGMYCIYKQDGFVDKYPLVNIFRVRESY